METLFTPWRYEYIKGKGPEAGGAEEGCFLCAAAREPDDPERLVVHLSAHHLVMLNRHPYTNGHLMIAPLRHLGSPCEATREEAAELWPLALECQRVLAADCEPDGFNLGINLGTAAGAGVPDHFHFHVVPRWGGDTNFMGVVAGVRMVPQALDDTRRRLRERFADWAGGAAAGGGEGAAGRGSGRGEG